MHREINQRELRNDSGEIMRALILGDTFTVTRRGIPLADLVPHTPRGGFTSRAAVIATFQNAERIDAQAFRRDVDAYVDQDMHPRA